jgi:WD40 repeat protein
VATCGRKDLAVKLWDAVSGGLEAVYQGHQDPPELLAFSPDGSFLASASNEESCMLWDTAKHKSVARLMIPTDEVLAFRLTTDDQWVLLRGPTACTSLVQLRTGEKSTEWRTIAVNPLVEYLDSRPRSVVILEGTDIIIAADFKYWLNVWNMRTGKKLKRYACDGGIFTLALSPDRGVLLIGCTNGKTYSLNLKEAGIVE